MSSPYDVCKVIGFLDDDAFKHGKLIHGVPVLGALAELDRVYLGSKFDELLLSSDAVSETQLAVLHSFARRNGVVISSLAVGLHPQLERGTALAASAATGS
jgi:FlaA1/EpsC-like NDP-sugar epimerase